MDIDITKKTENNLLKRTEVEFDIAHDAAATPSRETVAAKLAAMMNTDRNVTVIKKIKSEFGLNRSKGYANVYASEQARGIEPKYILKRNGLIGEE